MSPLSQLVTLGCLIGALTGATPFLFERFGDNLFIWPTLLAGLFAFWATQVAVRCPEREALLVILAIGIALRAYLIVTPPLLSDDIFRYIWDGRVQAAGINPYRFIPAAPELAPLRDPAIYPFINRADYAVTIYPPAAQMFFYAVTRLTETVSGMKTAMTLCEAVTVAALIALLRRMGRPMTLAVAYVWHPLALWEVSNNGHVDALMTALAMTALWLHTAGRTLSGGVAAAVGALCKPMSLLVLPAMWRPWDLVLPAVVLATMALLYMPYLGAGAGVLGFLPGYLREQGIAQGSGFWLVRVVEAGFGPSAAQAFTPVYEATAAIVIIGLALRAGFRRDRDVGTAMGDTIVLVLAFLWLLSTDYPWYHLIAVPLTALTGSLTGWTLTVGGFLLYGLVDAPSQIPFTWRSGAFNLAVLLVATLSFIRAHLARRADRTGVPGR